MRNPLQHSGRPGQKARAGFTLIELLTVVAIIGLLVGMVVPTISAVMATQTDVKSLARIFTLQTGVTMYKLNGTGNRYFPGQPPADRTLLTGTGTYGKAASRYLGWCLFSKPDPNFPGDDAKRLFPRDNWAPYEADMLDDAQGKDTSLGSGTAVPYSILDCSAQPMAILYYPSLMDPDKKGLAIQFVPGDNSKYITTTPTNCAPVGTGTTAATIQTWPDLIGPPIRMDGQFVIHAAGKERMYFAGKLRNWRE